MNEGWICPRCQKVNAPDVKACDCKYEESDIEKLKKLMPKQPEPATPFCPQYYPDWIYRPYHPYAPYWFIYTTSTGDTIGL